MRERMRPRHVVAIVATVSLAAVLAPVAVNAATGTVVNIADASIASRVARVTNAGTLTVETRAGSVANSFNFAAGRLGLGWVSLASVKAPTRLAITQLTLSARGPDSTTAQEILVEAMVRTSGSNGCTGPGTSGYTRHTLSRILVKNQSSDHVTWSGPPLVLPAGASGQPTCFGISVVTIPSGSATDAYGVGYRLTS